MILMKKNKKIGLILVLIIGMIAGIIGLIYLLTVPKKVIEEKTLYQYTYQPYLAYEVYLVENNIYESSIQPEDAIYIKKLIDYIQINFGASYEASEVVSLDMEYAMSASVVGYNSNSENRTDYWVKTFPLSDKKTIHMNTDTLEGEERIQIKLEEYEKFAEDTKDLTGMNLSTELTVKLVGYITAKTTYGTRETPIDIQLTIPLQSNALTITKGTLESITDKISKTEENILPVNNTLIVLIILGMVVCIGGIIAVVKYVLEPLTSDLLKTEIKKILKNHGSRMVALQSLPDKNYNYIYEVNSIKDLLVLSDELQKPIVYVAHKEEIVKNDSFYVEDKENKYVYKLANDNNTIFPLYLRTNYKEMEEEINNNGDVSLQNE